MGLRLQRGNVGFYWGFQSRLADALSPKVFLVSPVRTPTVSWRHGDSATALGPRSGQPTGLGPAGARYAVLGSHTHW